MKVACKVYKDLRHRSLVPFIDEVDIVNGYAAIFEWTDAECMGKQYISRYKFFELSIDDRIHIFEEILAFHKFVSEQGYVAIDF